MSEDFRNGKPSSRKYFVANRGSDSDDDSDDDRPAMDELNAYHYPPAYHQKQPQVDHHDHHRPTVRTDLTSGYGQYPIQRQPLSSPSSASSQSQPADESTPVPLTTPSVRGYPPPLPSPPSMAAKSMQSLHDVLPINERLSQDAYPARNGYTSHMRPSPAWGNGSGPRSVMESSSARRPKTSPAVSTPDSAASSNSFSQSEAIRICVTAEGAPDSMSLVEVSGLRDGSFIRRCILAKTHPNSDGQTHSIYRTLVGNSTYGDPLSDDQLMDAVKTEGDSRGTLRFFVTQADSDQQSSASIPRAEAASSSAVLPLRPKRRSRSRQNSVSSNASEHPFQELGYDADRDDDDSRKSTARQSIQAQPNASNGSPPSPVPRRRQPSGQALPPHPAGPPPTPPHPQPLQPSQLHHQAYPLSPPQAQSYYAQHGQLPQPPHPYQHPSSPISQPNGSKPPTPPGYFERQNIPSSSTRTTFVDRYGQVVLTPGPPPPLSPRRVDVSPEEPTSSISPMLNPLSHGRSNSDASTEREQLALQSEQRYDGFHQRYARTQDIASRSRGESPRESYFSSRSRRPGVGEQDWASSNGSDSNLTISDYVRPSSGRMASSRSHRSQLFGGPKQPTVPPPMPTETRPSAQRPYPSTRLIHFEKALRSKPPDSHGLKPKSSSEMKQLVKGKSMDNLRQTLAIKPAVRSPLPQVPSRPPVVRDPASYPVARSFEPPRPSRALPVQGSPYPPSPETSRFRSNLNMKGSPFGTPVGSSISSPSRDVYSRDPFARPRSAADNHSTSPTHQRQNHSPSFGSNLSATDHFRSSGPVSPIRPVGVGGPRPLHHHSNHSDRSSDIPSGPETSNSTPPRTPISPVSSKPSPPGRMPLVVEPSSPASDSNSGTFISNTSSMDSESTVRDDDKTSIQAMLKNMNAMLSKQHLTSANGTPNPVNDISDPEDYEDGGTWISHGDGGTWIVAPKRPPSARPELSKLRTDLPSDAEHGTAVPQRPAASQAPSQAPSQPQLRTPESNGGTVTQRSTSNAAQNRVSGFADATDPDDWAPRPLPEDVLDRLEEFFPEHDLDKLVIEANSGGNSPVTVEPAAPLPVNQVAPNPQVVQHMQPRRHKKSIRIVAEEQKKRMHNRVSRPDSVYANNAMLRKRSTKLWDHKLEEVDTMHVKTSSIPESPSNSSPSAPTFKWVRGELIGKGTYGRVYLALNATTGEMIAVKQVELPQTASDRNDSRQNTVVQALKLESETLKDLDHPHIVQYLGFEETPANLSIFLEYVPGGSIGSWLHKHGSFREDVTKSFTAQILGGLEYLHSKGIIHRDLKADNILVEMNGTCKISDFGISKRTDELHGGAFTALQGTVFWMAPEVINTQGKGYNFKIDIWSVGCVVLEMWGGRRPWTGQEMVAVMFKLYEAKLPPPVPDDVVLSELGDDLRKKCFAINPDERPSAAELRRHPYLELPPDWIFPGFSR